MGFQKDAGWDQPQDLAARQSGFADPYSLTNTVTE